jgi:hypothetical protein
LTFGDGLVKELGERLAGLAETGGGAVFASKVGDGKLGRATRAADGKFDDVVIAGNR